MELIQFIKIGGILFIGSMIQSSSGFGFGLLALPMLLLMKFSLLEAVVIAIIASAFQKIMAVGYMRKSVDWKGHWPYMAAGFFALPIGVFCMYRVSFLKPSTVSQLVGVIIFLLLLMQWSGRIKPRDRVKPIWGMLASFVGGFLDGLANVGGPPIVLWVLSHRWPSEKTRVTPLAFSLVFMPLQLLFMWVAFGSQMLHSMLTSVLVTPAVLVGVWVGLKIGKRISKEQLILYMRILLLFIVLTLILKPLL